MKEETIYKIEKFVEELENEYKELLKYQEYLVIDSEEDEKMINDAMKILKKRIKKLKNADEKEIKKLLRYKHL